NCSRFLIRSGDNQPTPTVARSPATGEDSMPTNRTYALMTCIACALLLEAATATAAPPAPAPSLPATQPVDLSTQKTLYTVAYAHLDTQWRWAYPLVIREYIANTLRHNFALFEKYPHYVF